MFDHVILSPLEIAVSFLNKPNKNKVAKVFSKIPNRRNCVSDLTSIVNFFILKEQLLTDFESK